MKKLILGVVGVVMVAGLLFGGNLIPYAQTAYEKASSSVQQQVPISFQIDAAKKQLENIGPEIDDMNLQIAKEKVRSRNSSHPSSDRKIRLKRAAAK